MQLSRIPDGDVHDHKTYYLALEEFERESFLVKCASCQCSLSQSLIVCRAVNITLHFLGVLSCVFRSLGFSVGCLLGGKDFVDVTLV